MLSLVQEDGRRRDPIQIIRDRARALVANARSHGWHGPPFDPKELASLQGITLSPKVLGPGHDAFIAPTKGQQLELFFDITRAITRQNFSISHEVIHTLFPDGYEMIRHRYSDRDRFDPDRELEQLCDIGAAEILMPVEDFTRDLTRLGFTFRSVADLRERYQASREAVIRRMVQLDTRASAAVFLEFRLKPSQRADPRQRSLLSGHVSPFPKLRVAYCVTSSSFKMFIPKHKSVPDTSCAYQVLSGHDYASGIETWDIPALPVCDVEAVAVASGDRVDSAMRVVTLLRPRAGLDDD